MSKGIRRPGAQSPFDTKQVIVAACGGIAMLLGATSVGVGMGSLQQLPTNETKVSSIVSSELASENKSIGTTSKVGSLAKLTILNGQAFFDNPEHSLYGSLIQSPVAKPLKNTASSVFNHTVEALNIAQQVSPPAAAAVATPSPDKDEPATPTTAAQNPQTPPAATPTTPSEGSASDPAEIPQDKPASPTPQNSPPNESTTPSTEPLSGQPQTPGTEQSHNVR